MTLTIETEGEVTRISLPKQFQDDSVEDFRKAVIESQSPQLVVSAAGVEKIGAAGVQVLVAARRHLEQQGGRMLVMEPSAALDGALEMLGLATDFRGTQG